MSVRDALLLPHRLATGVERVPLARPLSDMQFAVVSLLGVGLPYTVIAEELYLSPRTVQSYANVIAELIPGDLPPQLKAIAWARGATIDVLSGNQLRAEMRAAARNRSPLLAMVETKAGL